MASLLEIKNLNKSFNRVPVLKDLSLEIDPGQIYGILGPNGAGKTTLIKCLINLLTPDKGKIFFKGSNLKPAIHRHFGYLPENFLPPREITAFQFLTYLSRALGIPAQEAISTLKQLDLDPHKKIKKYSRGMIQRLGLAQVLVKNPDFIILDEPTLGLDPQAQAKMLDLLIALNKKGKTILFASHDLFHIEKICGRISILDKGKIKYSGPVGKLLEKHKIPSLEEAFLKELER